MENLLLDSIAEKLTMIEDKIAKTESLAISTNDSMKEVKEILNFLKMDHKSIRTAIEYMPSTLISAPTRTYSMPPTDNAGGFPGGTLPYLISVFTLVLAAALFSAGLGCFSAYAQGINQKSTQLQNIESQKAATKPNLENPKHIRLFPSKVHKGANFSLDSTLRNQGASKKN